jgi:hypothetical protein
LYVIGRAENTFIYPAERNYFPVFSSRQLPEAECFAGPQQG